MKTIVEGLRHGDLEDLVLPLLSIDEYESKVDDKAIVIGFYVNEHDAAQDLNRFIQRSPVELLDTEISPAPDQHGYYMVFVELLNNDRLEANINDILKEVSSLTKIEKWKMQVRGETGLRELDTSSAIETINKNTVKEGAVPFLEQSDLVDVVVDDHIHLTGIGGMTVSAEVVAFSDYTTYLKESVEPVSYRMEDVVFSNRIQTMMGPGWLVEVAGSALLLTRIADEKTLVLRLV